ncbi:hypothetical protein [Kitasatospora sp. NPDC057015]|uniref:hypothetical protein n=1 Tax=Kitasatospora sp. NPDC057015 TaxID=3346001 RepID=UPI00362CEF0D
MRSSEPAPPEEAHPHPRPGRCFGCVRLAEVTEAGVLTRGEVDVPLYVCSACLEHLEAWHAAQVGAVGAVRAVRAGGVRRPCAELSG